MEIKTTEEIQYYENRDTQKKKWVNLEDLKDLLDLAKTTKHISSKEKFEGVMVVVDFIEKDLS